MASLQKLFNKIHKKNTVTMSFHSVLLQAMYLKIMVSNGLSKKLFLRVFTVFSYRPYTYLGIVCIDTTGGRGSCNVSIFTLVLKFFENFKDLKFLKTTFKIYEIELQRIKL